MRERLVERERIQKGDVVRSRSGRDAGRLFWVTDVRQEMLMLCDGRMRRAEKPKAKKPKHVLWITRPPKTERVMMKLMAGEKPTNREIHGLLNLYRDGKDAEDEEGRHV